MRRSCWPRTSQDVFRVFDDAVLLLFLFSLQHQHNHVQCEYQLPIDNRITIAMLSTATNLDLIPLYFSGENLLYRIWYQRFLYPIDKYCGIKQCRTNLDLGPTILLWEKSVISVIRFLYPDSIVANDAERTWIWDPPYSSGKNLLCLWYQIWSLLSFGKPVQPCFDEIQRYTLELFPNETRSREPKFLPQVCRSWFQIRGEANLWKEFRSPVSGFCRRQFKVRVHPLQLSHF